MRIGLGVGIALLLMAAGCQRTLYDWGSYEQSVQHLYSEKPQADVARDQQVLIQEVRETVARKKQVPPGKYAHIGYLCYMAGDPMGARHYFEAEKTAYPESGILMDSLIARLQ